MIKEIKNKIQDNLIEPLKDKQRVMKLEYLLSHNYIIAVVIIAIDILIVLGGSYVINLLLHIPTILVGKADLNTVFSLVNLIPRGIGAGAMAGIVLLLIIVDAVLVFRIKVSWSEDNFNVGQRGTDRFITENEIKEQYTEIEPLEKMVSLVSASPSSSS